MPKHATTCSAPQRLLSTLIMVSTTASALAQPQVTLHPFDHLHTFESGGCGVGLYAGHLVNGLSAANREMAYDWLFTDLDNTFIRDAINGDQTEGVNDNADPYTLNLAGYDFSSHNTSSEVFRAAIQRNPRTTVILLMQNVPTWLRRPNPNDASKEQLDYDNPNLYPELAEWMFANLVGMKLNQGIDVAIIDIANEPDYSGKTFPIYQQGVEDLLVNVVPLLRDWVEDPVRNPYGVQMPKIMAPSCIGTSKAAEWLEDWSSNVPAAWDNLDVVSTHQYGGAYNYSNYNTINDVRDGRLFLVSEMHSHHQASVLNNPNELPQDWVEDQLEAALILGQLVSIPGNRGLGGYCYFLSNSPNEAATGLLRTQWNGTPERRKVYWAFKQLTSMQTPQSDVIGRSTTNTSGYYMIAYHKWREPRAVFTLTNADNTTKQATIELRDRNGNLLPILRAQDYETGANDDFTLDSDRSWDPATASFSTWIAPHSIRTFLIDFVPQPGDIDVNGLIDADDLAALDTVMLGADRRPRAPGEWAPTTELLDSDDDGDVDLRDALVEQLRWGA